MENESFSNNETAAILNNNFIPIKADREERPDIDSVYMSVCQTLTGQGGWPLTIIMDPDQKPFFAATYLPKKNRYGMIGLDEILMRVSDLWKNERSKLLRVSADIIKLIKKTPDGVFQDELNKNIFHQAYQMFAKRFDEKHGGFGSAPKFPAPHNLLFLIRYADEENNPHALEMVEKTLISMYRGGIFDHIGGGFSRYSTDEKWLVPHFEKMLYDNALLTMAYLEAYKRTEKKLYKNVAVKILDYVLNELTDENGGFYCGQDADSDGIEGKYYVFTPEEINGVLGEDGKDFCNRFDITEKGNFEGKSIPNLFHNPDYEAENPQINEYKRSLYEYRLKRTSLHKDDKILTSWNALMITAFSRAFAVLGDIRYLNAAEKSEALISKKLTHNNRLLVRYRDGDAAGYGTLDDYAFYVWSLLELYNATFNINYFMKAVRFADIMCENFFDYENGGFYLYSKDGEQLIIRPKETYDGAVPSGNSVCAYVLDKLAKLTGEPKWQEVLSRHLSFLAGSISSYPAGYGFGMLAALNVIYPSQELVCVSPGENDLQNIIKLLSRKPNLSALIKTAENADLLSKIAPFTEDYPLNDEETQFYYCLGGSCLAPVKNISELGI